MRLLIATGTIVTAGWVTLIVYLALQLIDIIF